MEKVRLSKLMSEQGICSRREADSYIEQGLVLVDGERVSELGTKIFPNQKITLTKGAQVQQNRASPSCCTNRSAMFPARRKTAISRR